MMLRRLGSALAVALLSFLPACSLIVDTSGLQSGGGPFTVGLSTYWPVVGETVRAIPAGPGSGGTVHYQWYRNGDPIDGATSSSVATSSFAPDDTLRVEAWTGSEADAASAGPVSLLSMGVRWRPLLPNSLNQAPPSMAYDAPHRRWLNVQDRLVWEYTVEGERLVPRPLRPMGAPPAPGEFLPVFMDSVNRRLFVLPFTDGAPVTELFVLDVRERGAESWSTLTLPSSITVGSFPSITTDPSGASVWILGVDMGGPTTVLVRIELGTPGTEIVTSFPVMGTAVPAVFGSALAVDPTDPNRILVFGGLDFVADAPVANVGIITVDGGTATYTDGPPLPESRFYSSVAVDASNDSVLLLFGITGDIDSNPMSAPIVRYDVAGATFDEVGPSPVMGLLGSAVPDPERGGRALLVFPGVDITDGLDVEVTQIMTTTLDGDAPAALATFVSPSPRRSMGATGETDNLRVAGGQLDDSGFAAATVWDLDLVSLEWTEFVPNQDPVAMAVPGPRADIVSMSTSNSNADRESIYYVGGTVGGGMFANTQVWELHDDGYWLYRNLLMPTIPPLDYVADIPQLRGAAQWAPRCGASEIGIVGGELSGGVTSDAAYVLECPEGDRLRDCYWTRIDAPGDLPARSYATAGLDSSNYGWFWGGFDGAGTGTNTAHAYDACAGSILWSNVAIDSAMMPMGLPPTGRGGHTMTHVPSAGGALETWIVFGGATLRYPSDVDVLADAFRFVRTGTAARRAEPLTPVDMVRPQGRLGHAAVWDPPRRRLIVFGGEFDNSVRSDVWELLVP